MLRIQKIEMNTKEELSIILNSKDIHNMVFWVGAGIGIDYPTLLPSGNELAKFILEKGFGDNNLTMLKRFKMHCELINEGCMYGHLDGNPRLETIISVLQKFESQKGKK